MNGLIFDSFNVKMVQLRFVGADIKSARTQKAVSPYNTRVATFSSLEVALADIIEALTGFKSVVADSKGQFPPACR